MRAYSTKTRSSNALRDSRPSWNTPLVSSTRSYATQTTNPNPPFGRESPIALTSLLSFANSVAGTKNSSNKTPSKVALIGKCSDSTRSRATPNHVQALEVTPVKVWNLPIIAKFAITNPFSNVSDSHLSEHTDCSLISSLDQPP